MTDYKAVFFDTAPLIYYLDDHPEYKGAVIGFIGNTKNSKYVTSTITTMEYLTGAFRSGTPEKEADYDNFLSAMDITIIDGGEDDIVRKAAHLRAEYKIKGMDALQLASAIESGCDLFFTNDNRLKQVSEITVLTVDEIGKQ